MFLNPLMLAWVVGSALPVIVHLLSRSRYRPVQWGAMMFLPGMGASRQNSSRIRQWVLMAVRSVTIGLLAVALARPVFAGRNAGLIPTAGLTTGGQATVVVVVDDSASMGYTRNGQTRLDEARAVALQILSGLKRGDQAALLLAGLPADQSVSTPVTDLQSIASRIGDLSPGNGEADFADTLNRAVTLLDRAGGTDHEIYVICDRQARSWRRLLEPAFYASWASRNAAGTSPRVTVFPVGGFESDNVAVDQLRVAEPPLIRDQPEVLQVRVRNFGTEPAVAVPLTVWSGPRPLGSLNLTLPPGSSRRVEFTARFPETGSFIISAAVKSAGLTFDDRLDRAVDVDDPIRVLLVGGDDPGSAGPGVTANLQAALAPNGMTNRKRVDPINVTSAVPADMAGQPLNRFNVIVLADISFLNPDRVRDVEQFVYDGGAVWFVPGLRVRAEEFNQLFYRSGSGIFPAALASPTPADPPADTRTSVSVSGMDRQHPIFDFIRASPMPRWSVYRFFPSTPRTPDARVIERYSSGQPFLIETTAGRGRVVMMTTAPQSGLSNLSDSPVFSSLAQSIVRYLTMSATEERNLAPNQPIVATVNGPIDDRVPTVQLLPGGRREPATVRRFEDRTEMRYYRTDTAGSYRLRYRVGGVEKSINFVVTGSRDESDLTPLTDAQLQSLRRRVGLQWTEPTPAAIDEAMNHQRGGRELWIDLLAGVLLLSLLELALTRWWSSGWSSRRTYAV